MKYLLKTSQKTVTTAGTRVRLATTTTWARHLQLEAPSANAGDISLGDVTVTMTNGRLITKGTKFDAPQLAGRQLEEQPAIDLSTLYVDAGTNADKISFSWVEPTT